MARVAQVSRTIGDGLKVLGARHGALLCIDVAAADKLGDTKNVLVSIVRNEVRTLRDTLTEVLGETGRDSHAKPDEAAEDCDECAGDGFYSIATDEDPTADLEYTCEPCRGSGKVQPPRLRSKLTEDERVRLWAHCVSAHAVIMSPEATAEDLTDFHDHEHKGPGTIRNHDVADRSYTLQKLGSVLSEAEPEDSTP